MPDMRLSREERDASVGSSVLVERGAVVTSVDIVMSWGAAIAETARLPRRMVLVNMFADVGDQLVN